MKYIIVLNRKGVTEAAWLMTEEEIKRDFPSAQWRDFGDKHSARLTEEMCIERFAV